MSRAIHAHVNSKGEILFEYVRNDDGTITVLDTYPGGSLTNDNSIAENVKRLSDELSEQNRRIARLLRLV